MAQDRQVPLGGLKTSPDSDALWRNRLAIGPDDWPKGVVVALTREGRHPDDPGARLAWPDFGTGGP